MASLDFSDFSGGITDNYLDAPMNCAEELDNFFIKGNKKLETIPGTSIYDDVMYQIPAGVQRIGSFPRLANDVMFTQSARNLYYQTSSWQTLLGPSSNPCLAAGATTNYASYAEWNGHLLVTTDAFGSPMKIYRDGTDVLRVRNAGLPKITLTAGISLANDLKAKLNAHFADVTEHTAGADTSHTISTADSYDFPTLAALTLALISAYDLHEADAELASAWAYHAAQEATDHSLSDVTNPVTLSDIIDRLDDIKVKYNAHDADGTAHGTDTLHQEAKFSGPQVSGGTTANSQYIYYFLARYKYKVGEVDFADFGPTYFVTKATLTPPNSSTVTISQIPVIANGTTENFDTANIVWEIYRTEQNLSTAKYIGEVTNGTTTYSDTASDASITDNSAIYTDGGVKDNDPPPQAKFVVVVDDTAYYAHVKEGGQVRKTRIRQSVKFDIDSCPEGSYIDLEDEIVGMGVIGIYPVAFCRNHIYRIEGQKDEFGRGVITKREISRGVGGINHLSIVNTYKGIFFAGSTGFYWSDGFNVIKITRELDVTYKTLIDTATKKARIQGLHNAVTDRVYWSVQQSGASSDNDAFFILDINFAFQEKGVFTTLTPDSDSWNACAIQMDTAGDIVIGDSRGYLFKFDDNSFTNPKIDISVAPSLWQETPIVYDYRGPGLNMGDANNLKAATHITVVADNVTPLSLVAKRKVEDSGVFKEMAEVRVRKNIIWQDPSAPIWMPTPDAFPWRFFPLIIERRRFVRDGIRFLFMQIQLTNSITNIYKSDDYGVATVAEVTATTKTATLLTPAFDLPGDLVDYLIAFESDNYVNRYLITAATATAITFVDVNHTSVNGTLKKWQVVGVRKKERLNLNSYSIEWEMLNSSHNQYRGVDGGNA